MIIELDVCRLGFRDFVQIVERWIDGVHSNSSKAFLLLFMILGIRNEALYFGKCLHGYNRAKLRYNRQSNDGFSPVLTTDNPVVREDFMECGKSVKRCSVMEVLPIAMLEALLSFIVVWFI